MKTNVQLFNDRLKAKEDQENKITWFKIFKIFLVYVIFGTIAGAILLNIEPIHGFLSDVRALAISFADSLTGYRIW